jgi:hypothetical protein
MEVMNHALVILRRRGIVVAGTWSLRRTWMYPAGILAASNESCKDLELVHVTVAVRVAVDVAGIAAGSIAEVDDFDAVDGPKLVMASHRQGTSWWSKEPIPSG